MLSGQLYDANDAALARERDRAKKLCRAYNDLSREDAEGRRALLEELLGRVGKACWIEPSFWCDYGGSIELGENFYANHNLVILDAGGVRIGENVLLGPNCGLYTSGSAATSSSVRAAWSRTTFPTTASPLAIPAGCCGGCRRTAKFLRKLAKRRRLWYNNHIQ